MSEASPFASLISPDFASVEMTFALIKSHAVREGHVGVILTRILEAKLIILMAAEATLTGAQIVALYGSHVRKPYWPLLLNSVSARVVPMILAGNDAVSVWRGMLGETDPGWAAPGTLRADFGNTARVWDNVAHGSDSRASAKREIALCFPRITFSRWV